MKLKLSHQTLCRIFCIVMAPVFVLAVVGDNFGRALLNAAKQSFTEIKDAMDELRAIWRDDQGYD